MKSLAVEKDLSLRIVDVPMPTYDDCRVLVKTLSCGVCAGTDTKIAHGKFKNVDKYPLLLGHEAVGEVLEIGKNVTRFKVGDHVLLPFVEGELGGYASAWGAYSEYGVCGDWLAMAQNGTGPYTPGFGDFYRTQTVLPKGFDPVAGAMIVTFREVLSGIRAFGFKHGESLVVFGAGPVGLCFVRFAKLLGLGPVISVDIMDEKIKDAEKAGADYAFNSKNCDIVSEIKKICPEGVDHMVDAVGVNELILTAMQFVKDGGQMCTYGISPKLSMQLDWSQAPYNWRLNFLQFPYKIMEAEANSQIINWIEMGVLDPNDFISHVFPFDQVLDAFDLIEKRQPCKKIVIKY